MRRVSQVLPFTLTEIFVLLFFALALVLVWQGDLLQDAEATNREWEDVVQGANEASLTPEAVMEVIQHVRRHGDSIPDDFTSLARDNGAARRTLAAGLVEDSTEDSAFYDTASVAVLADSAAARQARLQKEVEQLVDSIQRERQRAEQQIQTLEELLEDPESQGEALAACVDTVTHLRSEMDLLDSRLSNAQGQAEACYRRLGNGRDHPPCWATPSGDIEFAYEVTLRSDSVTVEPIWALHRRDDARRIPGMVELGGGEMSYGAFAQRAAPIWRWSSRQVPECRHFVRILDEVDAGKETYKDNLWTVERFFYKLLVN